MSIRTTTEDNVYRVCEGMAGRVIVAAPPQPDFVAYPKTPRLFREIVVTEKLDGTNSQLVFDACGALRVGSRNRWIFPTDDNFGFARWAYDHRDELFAGLGAGRHFGEWWGQGIQRTYGLTEKRFSLFNVARWADGAMSKPEMDGFKTVGTPVPLSPRPACCGVVPVLYRGLLCTETIKQVITNFRTTGSHAVPGWMKPEGLIVFHTAANKAFKVLLENDGEAKGTE